METEQVEHYRNFCGGYQVLMRVDGVMQLPLFPKIHSFYQALFDRCIHHAEAYGKGLQKIYEAMEDTRQRAQLRAQTYRLRIYPTFEDQSVLSYLCESALMGQWKGPGEGYRRSSQVWYKEEEQIMPPEQIMSYFGFHLSKKRLPFAVDGIYPREGKLVIFQNVTASNPFRQEEFNLAD